MAALRLLLLLAAGAAAQSEASSARRASAAEARVAALAERAKGGDEKSFWLLIEDAASPEFEVRVRALGALWTVDNRAAVPTLAPLVDDPSPFVQDWGSVSISAMWGLKGLTREGPTPGFLRRRIADACSSVWRRTGPGFMWTACARWTSPSFAPPPERMDIEKDRAYWRYWWRAHRAEYEGMTFERGRSR